MKQSSQAQIRKEQTAIPSCRVLTQLLKIRPGECVSLNGRTAQMVSVSEHNGISPEGREYVKLIGIFYLDGKKKSAPKECPCCFSPVVNGDCSKKCRASRGMTL